LRALVRTLRGQVHDVEARPVAVAEALGVEEADKAWRVRGAMVTRRPVSAGFAGCDVPFTTVSGLGQLLTGTVQDERPKRDGAIGSTATVVAVEKELLDG